MQEKATDLNDMLETGEIQIEDFIPYKEYPVGGYFRIGNDVFKVVNNEDYLCSKCDLRDNEACYEMACAELNRKDRNAVEFILYDSEE